jgi:MFS superfamily sulfate permease-like transporter
VQIAGPTGAFIVIVYGIVQTYGYEGLVVATLIAGVLLVIMGLSGFGTLLKFVPYPLTVGFTSGIALIIFSSQIGDFFGLGIRDTQCGAKVFPARVARALIKEDFSSGWEFDVELLWNCRKKYIRIIKGNF